MNSNIRNFKRLKKECSKILFSIIEINDIRKEQKRNFKTLKYSDENFKKIEFIEKKLKSIQNVKNNEIIYQIIFEMLRANKIDRFQKLFECENYLKNDINNFSLKKSILYSIDCDYLKEEIYNNYLKLINNEIFLNAKDEANYYRNIILDIIYNLKDKDNFDNIYNIASNESFWKQYNGKEKHEIVNNLNKYKNSKNITKLISALTNNLYFKEEYSEIKNNIFNTILKLSKNNIEGLIMLIDKLDVKTFNKNEKQLYKLFKFIEESEDKKQAKKYADFGITLFAPKQNVSNSRINYKNNLEKVKIKKKGTIYDN